MTQNRLHGQTALITGGGSGIGRETARVFLAEGCRVAIAGRSERRLIETWEVLGRTTALVHHTCDVADLEQVKALVSWATRELGRIDILVNNAGVNIKERSFRELTPERWRQVLAPNLDGAFFCTQAVLPQMLERRKGLIINVSSVAGKRASPLGGAAYAASKFGMSALNTCLGVELKETGVRCSTIYPGEVDTPILESRPQPVTPEHRAQILKPEDVAEAILFVACLPPRASVPELVIKPATQVYV